MTLQQFKSLYRVDTVPPIWKLPYWIYGYGVGFLSRAYYCLVYYTSKIEITGQEKLVPEKNYIFSLWHDYWPMYFAAFIRLKNHSWICHPDWYMKGVLVAMQCAGVKGILGSTGNSGKAAADELVGDLKTGYSTAISPDGPYGPFREIKKGILHLALQSQVQIIPLHFSATRAWSLLGGDRKLFPLPFGKISIRYASPIEVNETNFESVVPILAKAMD